MTEHETQVLEHIAFTLNEIRDFLLRILELVALGAFVYALSKLIERHS